MAGLPIIPIERLDDPRIAEYRHLADPPAIARRGLFVAEGRLVVQRLLAAGRFRTLSILVTPTALDALTAAGALRHGAPAPPVVYVASQPLLDQIAGFAMHRGCVALAERPPAGADAFPPGALARLLVLEGINNPDNVGGIFRSAAAFGAEAVLLGPGCGDPLYRKAIRTSMGATLHVPFAAADDWPARLHALSADGVRLFALTPAASATPIEDVVAPRGRVALLLGSEGSGLSEPALAAAGERVRIRMRGGVDSLNVVVAAAIAMHRLFV